MAGIHDGHRERLRKRYKNQGATMEPHELLEMLLSYALPRRDTNALAHKLLDAFGNNICNVFDADIDALVKAGLTERSAVLVHMVSDLFKKYEKSRFEEKVNLSDSKTRLEYCVALMLSEPYEAMYALCLNSRNTLIGELRLQEGTLDEVNVYARKLIDSALNLKASSVLLVHNHPGGVLKPSYSDIQMTVKLAVTLKMMDIDLIDHIIVAGNKALSMREQGYLQSEK